MSRPPTRTPQKLARRLGLVAIALLVVLSVGCVVAAMVGEYRWRTYRLEAEENEVSLSLPESGPTVPAERNLAAAPPFAVIKIGDDGEPIHLSPLQNKGLPLDLLPDPMCAQRADFAAARKALAESGEKEPMTSEAEIARAVLAVCDRKLGDPWKAVLDAEAKPEVWFNVHYTPPPGNERVPVTEFRVAGQVHELRAIAFQRLGKGKEAWDEIRGALRLVDALGEEISLRTFMVRAAITKLQMNGLWEGLRQGGWSDEELAAMEQRLQELSVSKGYGAVIDAERGWVNAMLDTLALGRGRSASAEMREWIAARDRVYPFLISKYFRRWVVRDNQLLLNQHYDAVREHIDELGNWQETDLPLVGDKARAPGEKRYALASLAILDFSKIECRLLCVEASIRQARLAIALERYRRVHHEFPAELDSLVPSLLPVIPDDPFDSEPMRYARDAAGSYRLWSIGGDHEDDHGVADAKMEEMTQDMVWPGSTPER